MRHRSKWRKSLQHGQQALSLQKDVLLDELKLKRDLSDLCHGTGVDNWQPMIKAIWDWIAEASGPERVRRMEALSRLVEELKVLAQSLAQSQASREQRAMENARHRIHELLNEFVAKLPERK
jgi:hypothetical protein